MLTYAADHGSFCKAVIELKPGAQIFSSKDPDDQPHLIAICVSMDYPLRDALLGTFGEKTVCIVPFLTKKNAKRYIPTCDMVLCKSRWQDKKASLYLGNFQIRSSCGYE